tara:strand:+ start:2265 stop:2396 length:132 start_codon:yes stop_codon:yes gene_type:complete
MESKAYDGVIASDYFNQQDRADIYVDWYYTAPTIFDHFCLGSI